MKQSVDAIDTGYIAYFHLTFNYDLQTCSISHVIKIFVYQTIPYMLY